MFAARKDKSYYSFNNSVIKRGGMRFNAEFQRQSSDDTKKNTFVVAQSIIKTLREKSTAALHQGIVAAENFVRWNINEVDEILLNSMLDAYGRLQQADKIDWTLDLMKQYNIPQSAVTWSVLVKSFGKAQKLDRVLETWEQMEELRQQDKVGPITYGCFIDACVKGRRMDKAWEAFQELKAKSKHKNTVIFSTLIKGLGAEGDKDGALALFREMREENITCNTITYNSVIDACVRAEDMETAEDIFQQMDCPFDIITISTLIKGFMRVKDINRAQTVFAILKRCAIKPDELSYNTLLDGCVRNDCVELGKTYFIEMVNSGLSPSNITFAIFQRLFRLNGYSVEEAATEIRNICSNLKTPNLLAINDRHTRLTGDSQKCASRPIPRADRNAVTWAPNGSNSWTSHAYPVRGNGFLEATTAYSESNASTSTYDNFGCNQRTSPQPNYAQYAPSNTHQTYATAGREPISPQDCSFDAASNSARSWHSSAPSVGGPYMHNSTPSVGGPYMHNSAPSYSGPYMQSSSPSYSGPYMQSSSPSYSGPYMQSSSPSYSGPYPLQPQQQGAFYASKPIHFAYAGDGYMAPQMYGSHMYPGQPCAPSFDNYAVQSFSAAPSFSPRQQGNCSFGMPTAPFDASAGMQGCAFEMPTGMQGCAFEMPNVNCHPIEVMSVHTQNSTPFDSSPMGYEFHGHMKVPSSDLSNSGLSTLVTSPPGELQDVSDDSSSMAGDLESLPQSPEGFASYPMLPMTIYDVGRN